MQKILDFNKSITFYVLCGLVILGAKELLNNRGKISSPRQQLIKVVPEEIKATFPAEAVTLYESAAGAQMTVEQFVNEQLARQEEEIWQEIETVTEITKEEAIELKDKIRDYQLSEERFTPEISPKLSQESIALTQEACADFGVDIKNISLATGNNTLMHGGVLKINQREHLSVPPLVAKAIVGHEMIHYQLDDCFYLAALQAMLKSDGVNVNSCGYQHPYYKLRRFQEMRADIIPALKDLDYSKASVDCLKIMLQQSGDGGYLSHPKTSLRLKEVNKIYQAMKLQALINV